MIGKLTEEEFMAKVLAFHGHAAPGVMLGGFLVEAARAGLPEGCLFDVISESRQCLPDAVQILTPCTFGNGWLQVHDYGLYAVVLYDKYTGEGFRAAIDLKKLKKFPETWNWFLKLKTKQEQDDKALRREILEHGAEMISVRPIRMKEEALKQKQGPHRCLPCLRRSLSRHVRGQVPALRQRTQLRPPLRKNLQGKRQPLPSPPLTDRHSPRAFQDTGENGGFLRLCDRSHIRQGAGKA